MTRDVFSARQSIPLPLALWPIRPMHLQTPRLQILHVDSETRAGGEEGGVDTEEGGVVG